MPYTVESLTAGASRGTVSPAETLLVKLHWYSSTSASKDNDPRGSSLAPSIYEALTTGPARVQPSTSLVSHTYCCKCTVVSARAPRKGMEQYYRERLKVCPEHNKARTRLDDLTRLMEYGSDQREHTAPSETVFVEWETAQTDRTYRWPKTIELPIQLQHYLKSGTPSQSSQTAPTSTSNADEESSMA